MMSMKTRSVFVRVLLSGPIKALAIVSRVVYSKVQEKGEVVVADIRTFTGPVLTCGTDGHV